MAITSVSQKLHLFAVFGSRLSESRFGTVNLVTLSVPVKIKKNDHQLKLLKRNACNLHAFLYCFFKCARTEMRSTSTLRVNHLSIKIDNVNVKPGPDFGYFWMKAL